METSVLIGSTRYLTTLDLMLLLDFCVWHIDDIVGKQ
jgi:hypothetical protein